jgi:hypothetical protein
MRLQQQGAHAVSIPILMFLLAHIAGIMEHFLRQNKALIALDSHFVVKLAPPLLCPAVSLRNKK